jgi:hypothetical protein
MLLNESTQVKRSNNIHWQNINDAIVILNPENGTSHELNQVATSIWNQIENKTNIKELIKKLHIEYDVSLDTIEADIKIFIEELANQKLIEVYE